MSDEAEDGGILEGIKEFGAGAVHYAGETLGHGNKAFVGAAEEVVGGGAEGLLSGEAKAIPLVGAGVSAFEVGYDGAAAVSAAIDGDSEGTSDNMIHVAEDLTGVVTGGVSGMVEGAIDVGNTLIGGDESTSAHGMIMQVVDGAADVVADAAYEYEYGEPPPE